MSADDTSDDTPGNAPEKPRGIMARLRRGGGVRVLWPLLLLAFGGGILFWGAFNTGMEATNTLAFCTACHEMRDTVYQEYKESVHYSNRSGVRVICSDCHVPKDWTHKLLRKIKASGELWGKLTGSIATPEKFEARRMELATNEWQRMKANDSLECRNCHTFAAMSQELQKQTPYKKHKAAEAQGQSCIDCHKGITHKLPKEYKEEGEE